MDYIFAAAKRSDTPEILKLYQRLIGTRGCNWYGDCPNRERVEHDIDDDSLYVVTDKKYNIIAVAALEQDTDADTQAWQSKNPCYLCRLGVSNDRQENDIAGLLIRKMASIARRQGHDGMRVLTDKKNEPAIKLYEHCGFIRCDETLRHGTNFFCYELLLQSRVSQASGNDSHKR